MFVSTISPKHSKPLQLRSLLDLFQIYQRTASESVHCFLKIAPKMQAVPDTDTTLWRKLSECSTSTDQPASLLDIVAYMQHTGGTEITHCALSEWY